MSLLTIASIAVIAWLLLMAGAYVVSSFNSLAALFVLGVVALGVAVSWQRVEQYHAQDDAAVSAALVAYQHPVAAPPPPPDHPRAGT